MLMQTKVSKQNKNKYIIKATEDTKEDIIFLAKALKKSKIKIKTS